MKNIKILTLLVLVIAVAASCASRNNNESRIGCAAVGAAGGAVIGGAITAAPRKGKRILLGHTKKETCSIKNTFKWVTKKEYSHSLIKYITSDGSTYQVEAKVIGIK